LVACLCESFTPEVTTVWSYSDIRVNLKQTSFTRAGKIDWPVKILTDSAFV